MLTWKKYDMNYQTKHKLCDSLKEDGNCKLGDSKPGSCKKDEFYKILLHVIA